MSQGYVYFFQAKDTRVKIGKTDDPHRRLRDLKRNAGQLTVIGVMHSAEPLAEEAAILRECAGHRIEGEWFRSDVLPMVERYRPRFLAALPEAQRVLVQSWVSPELYEVIVARAKSEGRSLASYMRVLLDEILAGGKDEQRFNEAAVASLVKDER